MKFNWKGKHQMNMDKLWFKKYMNTWEEARFWKFRFPLSLLKIMLSTKLMYFDDTWGMDILNLNDHGQTKIKVIGIF